MNDTIPSSTDVSQYQQFVWRRLEEPMPLFGYELPPIVWAILLGAVVLFCIAYVIYMYVQDSRGVGVWWASLLGTLRISIYVILALVFLLPARQTFIETRSEGKVIAIFDVSGSLATSDELPGAGELRTRQDKVIEFLTNEKIDFLNALVKKNPVTAYRFGSKLDEQNLHFLGGRVFTRQEKENPDRLKDGTVVLPPVEPISSKYLSAWLNPTAPIELKPKEKDREQTREEKRFEKLKEVNDKAVKDGLTTSTNIGDSLVSVLEREGGNRLQGVIVFTDGRNTESSASAFLNLEGRSKNIPIFVVGVGEDRQKVKLEFADVRVPSQVQPDDQFRIVAELTGEGLSGQPIDLSVEITQVVKNKKGEVVELPIELVEAERSGARASDARERINLGKKITLKPKTPVKFNNANPPRAEVEFQLDAAALAEAAKVDLEGRGRGKKWEIGETKDDAVLQFVVRVPADKREGVKIKDHLSEKQELRVVKKPLRVLLFASSANRDYQFVETQLAREFEKKRLELAVHLQAAPGEAGVRPGRVQDVPQDRMLENFPDSFEAKTTLMDLSSYDVIVAFDPDWERLTPDQIKMLQAWTERGGGLVFVAGSINTVELIRSREDNKFKPVLDMLPVVLDDIRDRPREATIPFSLEWEGATAEMEFLRLDEDLDESHFKDDWNNFFFGEGADHSKVERGFFNFYRLTKAKLGSIIVARFSDPAAKLNDGTLQPYLVLSKPGQQRVVWLGSAESWRLREYKQTYFERFWSKLVRYAGANSQNKVNRRIRIEMGRQYTAGKAIPIETELVGPGGIPLDRVAKPEITLIKFPTAFPDKEAKPLILRPRGERRDGWFNGKLLLKVPGEYEMQLKVPETGDTQTQRFSIKEANPELDNTRPDFFRMYRLSSEADLVLARIKEDTDRQLVQRRLVRPKLEVAPGEEAKDKTEISDKPRLYFDLPNADVVPLCMNAVPQTNKSKGPVDDLWDKGFGWWEIQDWWRQLLNNFRAPVAPTPPPPAQETAQFPFFLLLAVGILSLEWLIRKLLRLA
jgi:hypothetical protein